jgi:hypothetical protein
MTSKRRNGSDLRSNPRPTVGAGSDGIVGQEIFAHALSFERLRSERSGSPFLLMLLRVDPATSGARPAGWPPSARP